MKKRPKKIFCGGICKLWQRLNRKCVSCGLFVCGICEFLYHKKVYCINCFLDNATIMKDIKEEFNDMILQLQKNKKKKVVVITTKN